MALELPPDARTSAFQRQGAVGISDLPLPSYTHLFCVIGAGTGDKSATSCDSRGAGEPSPCSGQATDRPRQQEGPVFQKTRVQTPGTVLQVATYYASRSDHPRWAKAEDEGGPPPPSSSAEGRADGAFAFLTQIFPGGSAPGPRPRDLGRGQRPLFSAALGCRVSAPLTFPENLL